MQRQNRRGTGKSVGRRRNPPAALSSGKKWILLAAAGALVAVGIYFLRYALIIGVGTPKFYNVEINGVSLKGYTMDQARNTFDQLVSSWSSNVYTLRYQDRQWEYCGADFDASLEIEDALNRGWNLGHTGSLSNRSRQIQDMKANPVSFITDMDYDEVKLDSFVRQIASEIDIEPVDAEVVMDMDAPKIITQSRDGRKLDQDALRQNILQSLLTGEGIEDLPVEIAEPAVSSDEANGSLGVLSYYTTDLTTSNANRCNNVKLALNSFNALAIYDGDIVSFNQVVGERTKERGYREAPEYAGATVVTGYGGGSCQASTTLYCAVVKAGCDIIERHPHNMTVSYAEPSLDATVSWGSKDLIFQNNTGHTIYLYTDVNRESATVVVYGNRTEYHIDFQSVIVKENVESTKAEYTEDVTGKIAYYTDEKVLVEKGKKGCVSQGWIVYEDWISGEEVSRVQVSQDQYSPGTSLYYVGIHERNEPLPSSSVPDWVK